MKQLNLVRESGEPIQQYAGEACRGVELDEVARFRDDAEFGAGDSAREHVRPVERNPGVPFTPHYENRKCELVVAVLDVAGVTLVGLLYLSIERGLTVVAEPGRTSASWSRSRIGRCAAPATYSRTNAWCRAAGSCANTSALSATSRKNGEPQGLRATTSINASARNTVL